MKGPFWISAWAMGVIALAGVADGLTNLPEASPGLQALGAYDFRVEDGELLTRTKPLGYYVPPRDTDGGRSGGSAYGWASVDSLFQQGVVPVPRGTEAGVQRLFDQHPVAAPETPMPPALKWLVFLVSALMIGLVVVDLVPLLRARPPVPAAAGATAPAGVESAAAATVSELAGTESGVRDSRVGDDGAGFTISGLASLACMMPDLGPVLPVVVGKAPVPPPAACGPKSQAVVALGAVPKAGVAARARPGGGKGRPVTKTLLANRREVAVKG